MKLLSTIILFSAVTTAAIAQDCPDTFLGTKTLYTNTHPKYTPAPKGYAPVFINHVGRHGARHLTKEVKIGFAYRLLHQADSADALTAKGKLLQQMLLRLEQVEGTDTKSISIEGKDELQGIAQRMYAQNKALFGDKVYLNVGITKEIRTKQSADAFLEGFKQSIKTDVDVKEYNDDLNLRFYDLSPAYKAFEESGPWSPLVNTLAKTEQIASLNRAFAQRIFKPSFAAALTAEEQDKFTTDVFGFATIVYSLKTEIAKAGFKPSELNFKDFFTCAELVQLGKMDVADDFFKKGPGMDVNGIQVRIAVPLLANFIKTTNEAIITNKYNAQLRFAHAETIAPFAALLGISIADKPTSNIARINKDWQPALVAPLSANIQWVLYKKPGSDDYLIKVLLNEKESRIDGLKTTTYPYYKWNDLKEFYTKKLNGYGVTIYDDMKKYLKEIAQK